MKKFICFIIAILLNHPAFSIELHEALTIAYTKNDELKIIRSNFLGEIEKFSGAFSSFLPRVSYNINTATSKKKNGDKYRKNNISSTMNSREGNLLIEQPIFNGGSSVAALKAAQSTFRASRAKYYSKEQEILLDLIKTYILCYEAKEKYNIAEISLKANKQQLETAEEKLILGEGTLLELASAKAGLAKAENDKLTMYANLQAANAKFFRDFGIEMDSVIMPSLPNNLPTSKENLIKTAEKANLDVDMSRHVVKSSKADELAAKAQLLPTVSLKIQSGSNSQNPEIYNQIRRKVREKSTSSILSVNIPIYSQGNEYSKIRIAKNHTRAAAVQLDSAIKSVQASVIAVWEGFEAAKSKIVAATQGLEAAQLAYDGALQEERVGSKTILDVLTTEEKLFQAKNLKIDAHKETILAAYRIKSLTGELTAKSLKLKVKYFSPEEEFQSFKKKLFIGF